MLLLIYARPYQLMFCRAEVLTCVSIASTKILIMKYFKHESMPLFYTR